MKKISYLISSLGLLSILILIIIIGLSFNSSNKRLTNLNFKTKIVKVEKNAFGQLISNSSNPKTNESLAPSPTMSARQAGSNGITETAVSSDMKIRSEIAMMPPYYINNYVYIYKGEEIKIDQTEMEVYKRTKNNDSGQALAQTLNSFNFGLLDLSKFKNAAVDNISLNEDKEFGYSINLSLREGTFNIYSNWNKWPRPEATCQTISSMGDQTTCYENLRLKISDLPADENVVALADEFISNYSINMENYSKGEIITRWRESYEASTDKENFYIPETISVVYPLIINNQTVFEESGEKSGLMVEVSVRHNRAMNVYNLTTLQFESSNYAIENNSDKLISIAENGGLERNYRNEKLGSSTEIELGTPALSLIKFWQYDQATGESNELYVPSLIFPIMNKPDNIYFYRQNIVVPLAKEILANRLNDGSNGLPVPMPLIKGMEGSVSGSAGSGVTSEATPPDYK